MSNENVKNNDSKKILTLVVLIATIMITTTGATYAYFAISATATTQLTGTAASGGIALQLGNNSNTISGNPSLIKPATAYASSPMIPQLGYTTSNILQKAVTANCIDGNTNVVCRVYTFTVRNNSTATVKVKGRIYFNNIASLPNLRWALMTNATTVALTGTTTAGNVRTPLASSACTATTATTNANCWFETETSLSPSGGATISAAASGSYKQYWLVTWINETGAAQTDTGTWTATIEFTSSNGTGITSTITS